MASKSSKVQLQGDVARTIAGLPLTEANYINSVTPLEDHYGQQHRIVEAHIYEGAERHAIPSNQPI